MEKTNYLVEGLPNKIQLYKYDLIFNTDYRVWIKYEEIMLRTDIEIEKQLESVINLCFKDGIEILNNVDLKTVFDKIIRFFSLGNFKQSDKKEDEKEKDKDVVKKSKIIYSYEHDWEYIYSAFLECYNLDLFEINLHWWKFKALFNGLSEETKFKKILGYRSMAIPTKMSKEEKKHYREMQKLYALPDMRSEEEKEASFARSMMQSMEEN